MVLALPTPSTSHVSFDNVYEPAEDSFLLLDTLSSASEVEFLHQRFSHASAAPLVVEFGPGSGVVLAFVTANAHTILGTSNVITLGVDVNRKACVATTKTVQIATAEVVQGVTAAEPAAFLGTVQADLGSSLRKASVDVLIFNPPYVPTEESPAEIRKLAFADQDNQSESSHARFEADSRLLALSYAGGANGMETTNQFLEQLPSLLHPERGVAYLLLCAANRPDEVMARMNATLAGFKVTVAGHSGKKAGRETLQIFRICRAAHWRADDRQSGPEDHRDGP